MDVFSAVLAVLGLAVFELILSVDNAVINAHVLNTMSEKAKRWFLLWGMLIAVFLVRGLLPWFIIFVSNPSLGIQGSFTATLSEDPAVAEQIEQSKPVLLMMAGVFMVFLGLNWLFLEKKKFGMSWEEPIYKRGVWFYTVVAILLTVLTWFALQKNDMMAFGAVVGSTAFFITHGFKQNAEMKERELMHEGTHLSDWSKIMYLEVIDATFSIDGVLGAFAFTFSVPLIIIGSGLGAIAVRQLTISNIERVKKYGYLKNGAMYSVLFLGCIMILNAFGMHIPEWTSGAITFAVIGFFFWKSKKELDDETHAS
ncbi:MAG: DUF475 domain-containing protein [Candidatus Norongarragalinales archaeon]